MPKKYTTKVTEKTNPTADYWNIKLAKPVDFEYKAGQFISVLVNKATGERRSYSLASWPTLDYLELVIDTSPMGIGSKFILSLEVGTDIEILGPLGEFVPKPSGLAKTFWATGCGVVPLRSMIYDLLENNKFQGEITLHWGMRFEKDVFWMDEFKELCRHYPNFKFDLVLSKAEGGWRGCVGHLQDCLINHGENLSGKEAYVCGNREMVEEVTELLNKKGIEKNQIYFERFS